MRAGFLSKAEIGDDCSEKPSLRRSGMGIVRGNQTGMVGEKQGKIFKENLTEVRRMYASEAKKTELINKISLIPEQKLEEVIDFIDFIIIRRGKILSETGTLENRNTPLFKAAAVSTKGFKFDRNEANER